MASDERQSAVEAQNATTFDPVPFLELRVLSESYADAQEHRIRCANRMERGGVPPEMFAEQLDAIDAAEHSIELALVRSYRRLVRTLLPGVDLWQREMFGIGEKLLARLLGHLGHPRVATPFHWEGEGADRKLLPDMPFERTVSQLWAYCGHGDPTLKKRKGMSSDDAFALGNPQLKMLTHLLAEASMKCAPTKRAPRSNRRSSGRAPSDTSHEKPGTHRPPVGVDSFGTDQEAREAQPRPVGSDLSDPPSPLTATNIPPGDRFRYRVVYDSRRAVTEDRDHTTDCVRCGPSGKPALTGSPWSKAHQHADALRIVGKTILRDLWVASY